MAICTMNVVITPDGSEILMQMRELDSGSKYVYIGDIIRGPDIDVDAADKIAAAIGTVVNYHDLTPLFVINYIDHTDFNGAVHFYAAVLNKSNVFKPQKGLVWLKPGMLDKEPELFAGRGLLQYALHYAMNVLGFKKRPSRELRYIPTI